MIRQLRNLTRPVASAGAGARALAVYAQVYPGGFELRPAADTGYEGVACVDDAGRAAVLYCRIWQRWAFPWAREDALGLLRFLGHMQQDDGRFANFILDWEGHVNMDGDNSLPGGLWWTSRAMYALACAAGTFAEPEFGERFERGMPWLDQPTPIIGARAYAVLGVLEYWQATGAGWAAERAEAWAQELAESKVGDILPDTPGASEVHLWGHLQETALVRAGIALQRSDLVRIAQVSAENVFVPGIKRAFTGEHSLAFDASCAASAMTVLWAATGDVRYARLADLAQAWFRGRNSAGQAMYDRRRGVVYDGIDSGRINRNSGAESNIEGALALLPYLPYHRFVR